MLHEASIPFLIAGVVAMVIGSVALVGGAVPVADVARWTLPVFLLALGVAGLAHARR